ncbi:multidrug effflux MFS transporter [Nocardioides sp. Kera G14]|uniref:multidrug effflux MFS transporter n=1 Tax=Nocardioides sp. Kera G14 TaxID=2884264 RepID=UPI001D10AF4C|nr:multidrug effflux MFS transporter [Nocardioides sp. Kera G14]UDY23390.1 multidrug effflux MFS transporter [Nocardioides sp. Kera G14]
MTTAVPSREGQDISTPLILALALLSVTPPIATDLYLASFPEMQSGLSTDTSHIQLTLTAFLVGLGLGQLLWGPLSDRVGRWWPMFAGTLLAVVASAVTVIAPDVEVLIGARFVQALASAAGLVIGRAVISDLSTGYRATHALSLMMTINGIGPVAAPVVGGLLAGHVPWRGVLAVILAVMAAQWLGVLGVVRESLPPERRAARLSYASLVVVARRPSYLLHALAMALSFGVLMTYISSSSFVYQNVLGLPGWAFGVGFGVNSVGIVIAGVVSTRLARHRVHPAHTVRRALPFLLGGTILVLASALSPWPVLLLGPLLMVTCAFGFLTGNLTALAMQQARDHAGAGSAVIGGLQFLVGGIVSPLGGLAGDDTAVPMGVVMLGAALLCGGCFVLARQVVSPASETAFAS